MSPPIIIERLLADGHPIKAPSPVLPVQTQTVEINYTGLSFLLPKEVTFAYQLRGLDEKWQFAGSRRTAYFSGLPAGTYLFRVRAFDGLSSKMVAEIKFSIPAPWYRTQLAYVSYFVLGLSLIFGGIRWRLAALRRLAIRLEQTVAERTAEIYQQQEELRRQRDEIEYKNAEILESIRYAERIQRALLPRPEQLTTTLDNVFVVHLPRDIVSGDFYWLRELDADTTLLAVGDCTGHGVPGALMFMIGLTLLNQLVQEGSTAPAHILEQLHLGIRRALQQDSDKQTTQDGMDIGLCRIECAMGRLIFSSASFRAYLVAPDGELTTIKGDTKSVGGRQREGHRMFTQHEVRYADGTMLYLLTDGFTDQKSPTGEGYGSRRLKQQLRSLASLPVTEQARALSQEIVLFRGTEAQLDDITVVGVRLTHPPPSS
ncbi:MAG: PP2C family protein-serine/threonine phosphatase [Acidobacteriota bacterium]